MIHYTYDKEADVFYFSEGKPSASDQTVEAGSDVLLRINPHTKRVRGFTIINASRRKVGKPVSTPLPFAFSSIAR